MIYDRALIVYSEPAGTLLQHKLVPERIHLYADLEIYHSRYWESVAAGSRIDKLVEIPQGSEVTASQYVIPEDGHVYRIEQAQHGLDRDGLAITRLSLYRMEGQYDLASPGG